MEHTPFLREDLTSVVGKGQWVVLPYSVATGVPGLSINPRWMNEEQYQKPTCIGDYIYSNLNAETLHKSTLSVMQYVRAL